ncbi:hypothetical protein ACFL6R_00905 [Gemmatimonadota bacterium]
MFRSKAATGFLFISLIVMVTACAATHQQDNINRRLGCGIVAFPDSSIAVIFFGKSRIPDDIKMDIVRLYCSELTLHLQFTHYYRAFSYQDRFIDYSWEGRPWNKIRFSNGSLMDRINHGENLIDAAAQLEVLRPRVLPYFTSQRRDR